MAQTSFAKQQKSIFCLIGIGLLILLNIINNSVQAIETGKIIIRCELSGYKFKIQISDDGPGISPEILDRIFDPFFTTREQGSGLGLAISKKLVELLNGDLSVISSPGDGTTMTISLKL
jgi:two-component system sensor histidine kinase HydH